MIEASAYVQLQVGNDTSKDANVDIVNFQLLNKTSISVWQTRNWAETN